MNYIYYRLPDTEQAYRCLAAEQPEELHDFSELNGKSGFVIAPFIPTDSTPIVLLPCHFEPMTLAEDDGTEAVLIDAGYAEERMAYGTDFHNYHRQLINGSFKKIVLARNATLTATEHIDNEVLFARACRRYPHMFITMFATRQTGTWLIATPETLLAGHHNEMNTMALAGTMHKTDSMPQWNEKNIEEQHCVEMYIRECIGRFANNITIQGPYSSHAGQLVHLRSDIAFSLADTHHLGCLLEALHPTPAVGGLPKEAARQFINSNEQAPRGYYSGFSGIINPNADTHLFVTLRCMQMMGNDKYKLYAGGGLLADSNEQQEWEETEAKMNTIMGLFKTQSFCRLRNNKYV